MPNALALQAGAFRGGLFGPPCEARAPHTILPCLAMSCCLHLATIRARESQGNAPRGALRRYCDQLRRARAPPRARGGAIIDPAPACMHARRGEGRLLSRVPLEQPASPAAAPANGARTCRLPFMRVAPQNCHPPSAGRPSRRPRTRAACDACARPQRTAMTDATLLAAPCRAPARRPVLRPAMRGICDACNTLCGRAFV